MKTDFQLTSYDYYSSRRDMEVISNIVDSLKKILEEDKLQPQPLFLKTSENLILNIARKVVQEKKKTFLIGITGESASGKTVFVDNTIKACVHRKNSPTKAEKDGIYTVIRCDDYYKDTSKELKEAGSYEELFKENEQEQLGWNAKRELAKVNYRIHTDAIKENLIPQELTSQQTSIIYASEADVLNVALFGMTAKQWRENNPDLKGNIRDYASINELICLSNMENINAMLIEDKVPQKERLIKLNKIAIHQMMILEEKQGYKYLK